MKSAPLPYLAEKEVRSIGGIRRERIVLKWSGRSVRVHRFRVQRSRLGTKTEWTIPKPAEAGCLR